MAMSFRAHGPAYGLRRTGSGAGAHNAPECARPRVREKNCPFRSHLALISLTVNGLGDVRRSHFGHTLPTLKKS